VSFVYSHALRFPASLSKRLVRLYFSRSLHQSEKYLKLHSPRSFFLACLHHSIRGSLAPQSSGTVSPHPSGPPGLFLCIHLSFSLASVLLIYTSNRFSPEHFGRWRGEMRVFRKSDFRASLSRRYREIRATVENRCRCRDNFFLEMSIDAHAVYPGASSNASDVLRLMVRQESHTDSLIH